MSLTPGWEEKEFKAYTPGIPIAFNLTVNSDFFYIDNGSEFKKFPNTKDGWSDLCDELKHLDPIPF